MSGCTAFRIRRVVLVLFLLSGMATSAQEGRWRELRTLTSKLMSERRFADALRTGQLAIVVAENTWGPDSIQVADGLNRTAMLCFYLNEPDRTESMYKRAIAIYDKHYGPLHAKAFNSHKSLARLYEARGKLDDARRHYVDAQTIAEKRFGPTHPATEDILYSLAMLLMQQGNTTSADQLLRRILKVRTQRYGPRSMRVAEILQPLIRIYKSQELYDGLDGLAQRVLEIQMAEMKRDDPRLIQSHRDMGDILANTGRPELAEAHYRRELILREQHEGPDYYPDQEAYTKSASITITGDSESGILTTWNRSVGKNHKERITLLNKLGRVLEKQEKYQEARDLYNRALAICERAYGPDHPKTAEAVKHVAETCYAMGDLETAKLLYERIASLCDRARLKDDAQLETYLDILSQIYFLEARYDEAANTYERIAEIQQHTKGANHPALASTLNNLAEVRRIQGKFKQAERAYKEALAIYDQQPNQSNLHGLRATLSNMIQFYETSNRPQMAAPYRERLETLPSSSPLKSFDLP